MSKNLAEESMPTLGISFSVVFTYYVSQRGEEGGEGEESLKVLCMILGKGEGGWPGDGISK